MSFLGFAKIGVLILVPALISVYLFTYGMWAWRSGLKRGAAGVFFLVAVTFACAPW